MSRSYKTKSKRYKKRYQPTKNKKLSIFYLSPIIFVIAFVPLIVYAKILSLDGVEAQYWYDGMLQFNFFNYYKAIYFIIASYLGGVILLILYYSKQITFVHTKYSFPLVVYFLFMVISTIFADDMNVASRGYYDSSQGVFVLIGYLIFMVTIINLIQDNRHIKIISLAFIFVGFVVGLIGLGQYFGFDIFQSNFGKLLILPKELHSLAESLTFSFSKYAIYATLYNSNFVGSFAALMIPFSFSMFFFHKKPFSLILSLLFVGLMVFIGFGSNSRAGILGLFAAFLLIGIIFRKMIVAQPLKIIVPFAVLFIVGLGLNIASNGRIINELKNLSFTKDIENAQKKNEVYLEDLIFDFYTLDILTSDNDIRIEYFQSDLVFTSLDGESLAVIKDGRKTTFVDPEYQNFMLTRSETGAFYTVVAYGRSFNLWLTIDGFKFEGISNYLAIPSHPDNIEFLEGYGSLFSSRMYIWSRSIPLLKNYLFIGAGPDMFPLVFPQDDYVGKLNYMSIETIIDKPHNMYIQTGINTGVISLIALLSVFIIYIIDSFKLYINRSFLTFSEFIGAGMFISVAAYLVSGFFNDQIMSVAPLFYGMLALGIAINRMVQIESK